MTSAFDLPQVEDAVWPARGSTTGRAIESAGRRLLFEQLKQACAHRPTAVALAASFAARLPGNPHAISKWLDDVGISVLLRVGLEGDAAAFDEGVHRLRHALGDEPAREGDAWQPRAPTEAGTVEAMLRCIDDAAMPIGPGPNAIVSVRDATTDGRREALDLAMVALATHAPALHDERRRFLRGVRLADATTPPPACAVGVCVLHAPRVDAALAAFVEGTVRGKLHTLAALRGEPPAALDALVAASVRVALGRVEASVGRSIEAPPWVTGHLAARLDHAKVPASFADVLDELALLSASAP